MIRVRIFCPLILLLAAPLAQGETPTLDEVRSSMDAAWKDIQSMSADVRMDFLFPVGTQPLPVTADGTFDYLREDGKDKSRQQVSAKIPEPFAMELKLDILFDGKQMHTTVEMMGQKQHNTGEPSLEQGALPPGGPRLMAALERLLNLTVLPNETLDGHPVFVLEGTLKDQTQAAMVDKFTIYIDQELAVQRKTEVYHQDGTVGLTVLFSNIRENTEPDPKLFIPAG